jgi:hypothetical protein
VSDIAPSEELVDLLNLRLGKILRSDADYEEMYQRRLTRLDAIRLAAVSGISIMAERAMSLTRSSHDLADRLASEIRQIETLTTETLPQRVERLLNRSTRDWYSGIHRKTQADRCLSHSCVPMSCGSI